MFRATIVNMKKKQAVAIYLTAIFLVLLLSACTSTDSIHNEKLTVESADGSHIAYEVNGQGKPTLIFVHGWLGNRKTWQPQVDHFSNNYKVISLDLAGHGDSKAARQAFTMSAFAQDVKAVADKAGGNSIIFVGHSMGGPIVIEAANLLGEKVIGLVGVDAFYTPLASVPEKMKMKFLEQLKNDFPTALKKTVRSMFAQTADSDLINSTYKNMLANDHLMGISALYECIKWNSQIEPAALKEFSSKLYNINGAPTGSEKALHESVILIPGVGHFVAQVKPDEFNAALESILKKFKTQ